ncbi:putative chromophore lyase CpcT/CpeT [Dioscorea sansibarensis]
MGTDSDSSGGGIQAHGLLLKALMLVGGALFLKRLRKSRTRWDNARVVAKAFQGRRDPDDYFNLRHIGVLFCLMRLHFLCYKTLTCHATDVVDGSRVLYFEQHIYECNGISLWRAFWRAPQKPF